MKGRRKKLYNSKDQLVNIIIIVITTLLVCTVICCILLFGLENACSREISNAYKSTVSKLSNEIHGIGGLTGDILNNSSSANSSEAAQRDKTGSG